MPKGVTELTDDIIAEKLATIPSDQEAIVYRQWLRQDIVTKGKKGKKVKLCDVTTTRDMFIREYMVDLP